MDRDDLHRQRDHRSRQESATLDHSFDADRDRVVRAGERRVHVRALTRRDDRLTARRIRRGEDHDGRVRRVVRRHRDSGLDAWREQRHRADRRAHRLAMARAGVFFPSQGVVHSRYGTPTIALITQGVIASVLTALGRYDQLFTYVVFAQFVFYALSAGAVIRLRSTEPEVARPYRTWGYPLTPLVFIAFALWLVFNTIRETPVDSAVGAGIILVGLPGYFYWKKRR